MNIDLAIIATLVGIIGGLAGIVFGILVARDRRKKTDQDEAADRANMKSDIKYIRISVDEMRGEVKELTKESINTKQNLSNIDTRLCALETKTLKQKG